MKKLILMALLVCSMIGAKAQQVFVTSARIVFEKKVNMLRKMADNTWLSDDARDKMKKYVSTFWEYSFNESTSSYKIQKAENTADNSLFYRGQSTAEMFTDMGKSTRVIKKTIMGDDFILKDTIPKINWKIMHDVRKIAGYECRKAIGIINDSVTVVAFYSDEILLKGGPEGFTGLPGMILGLAIPRYNTTWFATKVESINIPIYSISAPTKGKRTDTEKDFKKMIDLYTLYQDKKHPMKIETIKKNIYGLLLN